MAKILCVLYPDPEAGYPPKYARDDIPVITDYANGQTAPTPKGPLGFKPGELVGCVSGELGLRSYLEKLGHELIVTSDKDGPNSEFEKHLPDAEVVISQPFWPAYLTKERIAKAKKLKLALTAGIGSDHDRRLAGMDRLAGCPDQKAAAAAARARASGGWLDHAAWSGSGSRLVRRGQGWGSPPGAGGAQPAGRPRDMGV